jgi:hypothetical protein
LNRSTDLGLIISFWKNKLAIDLLGFSNLILDTGLSAFPVGVSARGELRKSVRFNNLLTLFSRHD